MVDDWVEVSFRGYDLEVHVVGPHLYVYRDGRPMPGLWRWIRLHCLGEFLDAVNEAIADKRRGVA